MMPYNEVVEPPERNPSATRDELKAIVAMGQRLVDIEGELEDIERRKKALTDERTRLRSVNIPDAMSACEMTSVGVGNRQIVIDLHVHARPPKDPVRLRKAVDYLVDHGEGGCVERTIAFTLPKGDAVTECKVIDALRETVPLIDPHVEVSVQWKAYESAAKRLVKSGKPLPDYMDIFIGRMASVE